MIKVKVNGKVTCQIIAEIKRKTHNENVIIVIDNTKFQSEEELRLIANQYPNIIFSVQGGLNPKKSKYNNEYYQERTYYSAMELSKIVKIYRDIEKKINLRWTETEKAMFLYKELCDRMEYSEVEVNGKDYSRGIGGLLYNKAVCSGFAMIYKEALDRIGIECYYQNREGYHSWNIAKLDGEYRGIELTWDTYKKSNNGCEFYYFNRDKEPFYSNKHHDISNEREEKIFNIVPYTLKELQEAYGVISRPRIIKCQPDQNHQVKINVNGNPVIIYEHNNSLQINTSNQIYRKFTRMDGSSFIIIQGNKNIGELHGHVIVEAKHGILNITNIYSEERLATLPFEYNDTIANGLLSSERLARKINNYNGYVGYIGKNHGIYYQNSIEDKLNMRR